MVFMWDRWNDLFRSELTFVERSLISELRDFRNRWAHQNQLTERDVYRVLDDIERLLTAIGSSGVSSIADLRRESLGRLWSAERGTDEKHQRVKLIWPYILLRRQRVCSDGRDRYLRPSTVVLDAFAACISRDDASRMAPGKPRTTSGPRTS